MDRRSWSFFAVAAMIVVDLPILMVMSNKDVRYCSPLLLAVALTIAGLTDLAAKANARAAVAATVFAVIAVINTVELTLPMGTRSLGVRMLGTDLPVVGSHGYTRGRLQTGNFVLFQAVPAATALLNRLQAEQRCIGTAAIAASGGSNDLYTNRGSADGLIRLFGARRAIDLERPCVLLILATDDADLMRSTDNGRYRIAKVWSGMNSGPTVATAFRVT